MSRKTYIISALIIIIALVGIVLHFIDLDCDPPLYFDGYGQSLSTDPYHGSYFARNKLLFGESEILDSSRWRVFRLTLVSWLSYLLFDTFGISRFAANASGLVLILLAILIFLLAIRRFTGIHGILLALAFLIFNKVFYVYGRLPYTENGMIFIITLLFLTFVYGRHQWYGRIAIGILLALAALAGKIFGGLLVVPIIVSFWFEKRRQCLPAILTVIASSIIVAVLWAFIFYGQDLRVLVDYYQSQTLGLYGFPDALKSPVTFIERLISFGNDARFYFHAPVLGLAAFLVFLALTSPDLNFRLRANIPLFFLIIWFVAGQLFFMISNYRPLRYTYMLYLPLVGIAAHLLTAENPHPARRGKNMKIILDILAFFLFWILIEQLLLNIFFLNEFSAMYPALVWLSALVALVMAAVNARFKPMQWLYSQPLRRYIYIPIVLLVMVNFALPYQNWNRHKSFNFREADRDLAEILNENAVLCGPIAPSLAFENDHKIMLYAVGISDRDPNLFQKYPITHFGIDASASGQIVSKYPELEDAEIVSDYWLRDSKILIVRTAEHMNIPESLMYRPTDYEIGRWFMNRERFDSALFFLERFIESHPDNKSTLRLLGELYPIVGKAGRAEEVLQRAVSLYPRDFSVHMSQAILYQKMYLATGDIRFKGLAVDAFSRVIELNPYQFDEIEAIIRAINQYKQP